MLEVATMADITKCPGNGCPIREDCYRYTAPASEHQSWFTETPGWFEKVISGGDGEWYCEYYRRKEGGDES
jgi:hypothetical protein